jgi:hypothetical protein
MSLPNNLWIGQYDANWLRPEITNILTGKTGWQINGYWAKRMSVSF